MDGQSGTTSTQICLKFILLTLSKETKSPFEPKSDEVKLNGEEKDKDKDDKNG
jgi:hypothetical protein